MLAIASYIGVIKSWDCVIKGKENQRSNKSTACGCKCLAVGCLTGDKRDKSKKGHNSEGKKMHSELTPSIAWIALWIVNTYFQFQVNILSNNRGITKCHSFCMTTTTTTKRL